MSVSSIKPSLLSRASFSGSGSPQNQADDLVGGFTKLAADWRALAAMMAGGMAYRMGRIGVMGLGRGPMVRALSVGLGLGSEVSAFELVNRGLTSLSVVARSPRLQFASNGTGGETPPLHPENPNLWRWSGPGGIAQGLLHSFISFGTLKGAGSLARGQNVFVQHLLQDSAMVAGHQASGILGLAPRPGGSLAEQFLHAEAMNLQIGAGMVLAHRLAPGFQGLERGLDLSLRTVDVGAGFPRPQIGSDRTGAETAPLQPAWAFGLAGEPRRPAEERKGPEILQMSALVSPSSAPAHEAFPPDAILVNSTPLNINRRLDHFLKLISGKEVASQDLLPLLFRYPQGFRLKKLGFTMLSDGRLKMEGHVEKIGGLTIASFERVLFRNPDIVRSPLYAMGQGTDVAYQYQGKGIGTSTVLNEIEFYRALDIPYFLVPVGKKGGRFWPNLGFDFADSTVREKILQDFREHLDRRSIDPSRLGPLPLFRVRHSWNLLHLATDERREVGKEFLLNPYLAWDSLFKLHDEDYPGWELLERAAQKIGRNAPR